MSSRGYYRTAVIGLSLLLAILALPVHAQTTGENESLSAPENVVAQRYSDTTAEIFWERPETVGLRYEISRDGVFQAITEGVSYFDQTLSADSAPTYDIIAINRQDLRSVPTSITVPTRNPAIDELPPPAGVTATRYSDTAAEVFWTRSSTFGLHYEVSRDGTLLSDTSGISYFDESLGATSSPTYSIVAIDREGRRSSPSSITVPTRNNPVPTPASPSGLVAQRYSRTSAEIFWTRPTTFGLSYEISRDGTFMGNTTGVSYLDDTLNQGESPTYAIMAIDRQGLRSLPSFITVPAFGEPDPEPVDALITLDSYESILKELVELINGTPLFDTLNTQPAITQAGITLVSVSSEAMEDEAFGLGFVYDYSCDAGGSIEEFRFTEPGSLQYTFEDCILESGIFNGVLKEFFVGREGSGVTATAYTVDTGDQTRMLSGRHESSSFRGIAGLNRYWQPTDLDVQSSESTLALRSYELEATSVYNPPEDVNDSNLRVSFDVTAAWTRELRIHVEVSLQTSMEPDSAFTWQTGEVVAVADDGSQMTLTPADASQRTFNIALSEIDSLLTRQWSEGFEIHCAFADIDTCGSF